MLVASVLGRNLLLVELLHHRWLLLRLSNSQLLNNGVHIHLKRGVLHCVQSKLGRKYASARDNMVGLARLAIRGEFQDIVLRISTTSHRNGLLLLSRRGRIIGSLNSDYPGLLLQNETSLCPILIIRTWSTAHRLLVNKGTTRYQRRMNGHVV
jgi:hypothetical protein